MAELNNRKVVGNVDDDILCPICSGVMIEASGLPCGHEFCKTCINNYIKANSNATCPMCRATNLNLAPNYNKQIKINRLEVKCIFCNVCGLNNRIEAHEKVCAYRQVIIPVPMTSYVLTDEYVLRNKKELGTIAKLPITSK